MDAKHEARGAPIGLGIASVALALLLGGAGLGACCLVRPPGAKELYEAGAGGMRTPESAFETYRVAFGADLPELEYRCLSADFRRVNGISYLSYRVAREQLLEQKPYLAFLAKAQVQESRAVSAGRHRLLVKAAGQRFVVDLVREDEFKMYAGEVLLADGLLDFERAIKVQPQNDGSLKLGAVVNVDAEQSEGLDLSRLTSLRLEQVWKIDNFGDEPDS
jgi:hypothetical protein